ncbi:MAG: hypothetical protein HUJ26_12685 [Planctomycetaceae bacterium]|nr:hypothetical protein [Planctomycetaceae bacterium]
MNRTSDDVAREDAARRDSGKNTASDRPKDLAEFASNSKWIPTRSGKWIDLDEPNPRHFNSGDIAHALAKEQRFGNQLPMNYSVADHCVILSHCVPVEYRFEALMHDASEAYLRDLAAPYKRRCGDYKRLEERFERAIAGQFQLPHPHSTLVKMYDRVLCQVEGAFFYQIGGGMELPDEIDRKKDLPRIQQAFKTFTLGQSAESSRFGFLLRYNQLRDEHVDRHLAGAAIEGTSPDPI